MIKFRPANMRDLPVLKSRGTWSETRLESRIRGEELFVAKSGEGIIGFCVVTFLWDKTPFIEKILIQPEVRRKGVGRTLLRFVEQFLFGKDCTVIYSSSQANEPEAQTWHRKMGFVECGIIAGFNQGGVGEVFFRRRLRNLGPVVAEIEEPEEEPASAVEPVKKPGTRRTTPGKKPVSTTTTAEVPVSAPVKASVKVPVSVPASAKREKNDEVVEESKKRPRAKPCLDNDSEGTSE